jgi:hypothetical protein
MGLDGVLLEAWVVRVRYGLVLGWCDRVPDCSTADNSFMLSIHGAARMPPDCACSWVLRPVLFTCSRFP